jgi:methylthioxylose transferase
VKGNPPGPLIAFHLLGITTAKQLTALCIGLGALTAPLAYDLGRILGDERRGRVLGDERRGRLAAVLTAFSPALLLFGVTSVDYAFAALGMIAACLLVRDGWPALIAGSIAAAFASFFSWLLLGIPAWAAVVTLRRRGLTRAAALSLAVASAVVLLNAALFVIYGYNPFTALSATAGFYSHGIATIRPYAFWLFGSPAAWAVMLGLPVFWFMLRSLRTRDAATIAICTLVLVASVIGLTKAETERIWLPFVPLACVAAAAVLPTRRLHLLLGFLAFQALAIELLFFTTW